jgi:hypothetical protein
MSIGFLKIFSFSQDSFLSLADHSGMARVKIRFAIDIAEQ